MFKFIFHRWNSRFRSIELFWLGFALALSVAALTSVTFLSDRLHQAFEKDARKLIAADMIIQSDLQLPELFEKRAISEGLRIAKTIVFPTMATNGNRSKLVSLKAVTGDYPLRGEIKLRDSQSQLGLDQAWIDPALIGSLGLEVGSRVELGEKTFEVSDVIVRELDRGAGFMNFAPRIMVREQDLAGTELIGLGSRISYRLLVAAPKEAELKKGVKQISDFELWVKSEIDKQGIKGVRVENIENGQPVMRKTLDRAEKFLSLVALLTAMVSAVGVALTSQRYAAKQSNVSAVWRCLGASQSQILWMHAERFIVVAILAGLIGVGLGWLSHTLLTYWVGGLLLNDLPSASWWPAIWGVFVSLSLFFGFSWPPLLALSKVSPIRALRKDYFVNEASVWQAALFGLICFSGLLIWVSKDVKLAFIVLGSFIVASGLFLGFGYLFSFGIGKQIIKISRLKLGMRFSALKLLGAPLMTALQIAALGIALMSLLLLIVLRNDLLSAWQSTVPKDAPNRFLINIQTNQKDDVISELRAANGSRTIDMYPMVRGRLTEVNGKPVSSSDYDQENAQRLVDREFNLSYADQMPSHNKLVDGKWFDSQRNQVGQVSMEQGIMKTLRLKLGDRLVFDIAGQPYEVTITSVRKLDWNSMRVNFFAIMPPDLLKDSPQSWISAYRQLPDVDEDMKLVSRYPNLTVVDIDATLNQVQEVLSKLTMAIQLLFGFALVAGGLVLAAALASSQERRMKDAAILKTMGAGKTYLLTAWRTELLFIGSIAGLLGGVFASIATYLLARFALEIEMSPPIFIILVGVVMGSISSLLAGYWIKSKVLNTSPVLILQDI